MQADTNAAPPLSNEKQSEIATTNYDYYFTSPTCHDCGSTIYTTSCTKAMTTSIVFHPHNELLVHQPSLLPLLTCIHLLLTTNTINTTTQLNQDMQE